MQKLLATDEGLNCLVPKPVLIESLTNSSLLELYHGADSFRYGDDMVAILAQAANKARPRF